MAKKEKRLYCFDVKIYDEKLSSKLDIFQELKRSLSKRKTVETRYRQFAAADETGAGEFIANYKIIKDKMLMACFIAMKKGVAPEIKKAFFAKESFSLSDIEIEEKEGVEGHIKDHAHFLLTKDFVILKGSQAVRSETISTYLNWLLLQEKEHAGKAAVFRLPVHLRKTININDISAFSLGENFEIKKNNVIEKTLTASKEFINEFFSASKLNVDTAKILDAYITFKIKKVAKEDEDEKREVIQMLLENLKGEDCSILNKRGTPIDVNEIKSSKPIRIAHTDSGFPDEAELEKETILYLQEVTNEKNNNTA